MDDPDLEGESLAEAGERARLAGDWATSLRCWSVYSLLFPETAEGSLHAGESLWRLGRYEAADDLLRRAMERFPDSQDLVLSYAWAAMERRVWDAAEARFVAALERFPDSPSARFGLGMALRELHRPEEAEAVVLKSRHLDPPSQRFLAELGVSLGKVDEALGRWRSLIEANPDDPELHAGLIGAYRAAGRFGEADDAVRLASERFPEDPTLVALMAQMGEDAGDLTSALSRWDAFKTLFGSLPDGYLGAARVLLRMGRLEDAELVLAPALRLFADDSDIVELSGDVAYQSGRWPEAMGRYQALKALEPDRPEGYLGEILAHRGAGRSEEADALALAARLRFPEDFRVACSFAEAPQVLRQWLAAIDRWRVVVSQFPDETRPLIELSRCLTEAGQFEESDATLASGLTRFPARSDLLLTRAELMVRSRQAARAGAAWSAALESGSSSPSATIGYANHLLALGDAKQAVQVLDRAAAQFGSDPVFTVARAKVMTELRDWSAALPLWKAILAAAPQNKGIRAEIERAVAMASEDYELALTEAPGTPEPFIIPVELLDMDQDDGERDGLKSLFLGFESLGDTCEFGIVQRRYGAEPLSLMRWTNTPPDKLAEALRNGLEGVGDPVFTDLKTVNGEYITYDTRYHMQTHTFSMEKLNPREKFFSDHCKRIGFLRKKLLKELEAGEKIFVYASLSLTPELIDEIFEAMRSLGPAATLLCVRVANSDHQPGSVSIRRDGLLVGAVRKFSTVDTAVDDWIDVCRSARNLVQAGA